MMQQNFLGRALSAKEMMHIVGGDAPPRRKNVCVICGPMNVHCASVLATADCEVLDYSPGVQGWMGCKDGSEEDFSLLDYTCRA